MRERRLGSGGGLQTTRTQAGEPVATSGGHNLGLTSMEGGGGYINHSAVVESLNNQRQAENQNKVIRNNNSLPWVLVGIGAAAAVIAGLMIGLSDDAGKEEVQPGRVILVTSTPRAFLGDK